MITAKEALEKSNETSERATKAVLELIQNKIIEAAEERGDDYIYYHHPMSIHLINKLKSLGYTIKDNSTQKEGYSFTISWKDADKPQIPMRGGVQDTV